MNLSQNSLFQGDCETQLQDIFANIAAYPSRHRLSPKRPGAQGPNNLERAHTDELSMSPPRWISSLDDAPPKPFEPWGASLLRNICSVQAAIIHIPSSGEDYRQLPVRAKIEERWMPCGTKCFTVVTPLDRRIRSGTVMRMEGVLAGRWIAEETVFMVGGYAFMRMKQNANGLVTLIALPHAYVDVLT